MRYRMLEIIHQYAFEKLQMANKVATIQGQHLLYYSEFAQRSNPGWFGSKQAQLIRQFDAEYPNLRVALAWGLEAPRQTDQLILGIELASALGPFWNFLAEYNEGQMWLKRAIEGADGLLEKPDLRLEQRNEYLSMKAKALYECGFLVWFQSFYSKARTIFLECSELYREVQDDTGLAYSNMFLAHSTWGLGETDLARKMWAESLAQFNTVGDKWGAGMVRSFLGRVERESANYEQAEYEYTQCLELFTAVGDKWGLGISLSHLGMLAFQKDDPVKAMDLFKPRLMLSKDIGFKQSVAYSIFLMGMAAWKLGDPPQVQTYMCEALPYVYELGNYVTLTECLLGLAWAEAEAGHLEQAAYLFGTVTKADETDRVRMGVEDIYFHRPIVADLQSRLKEEKYQAAWERGRRATLDQVTKEILEA
jgi:tetratricopeptide (TPR) repeat protein